jgi:hypothetical protein
MHVDLVDLVWAAVSIGKPSASAFHSHGLSSYLDGVGQACTILSVLDTDGTFFFGSSLQRDQDSTDLAYSSNKTGGVLSKLVASQLFGVRWLFHASLIEKVVGLPKFSTRKRPDFVGMDAGFKWYIVEAKGNSGPYDPAVTAYGKKQTRSLRRINGDLPCLRAVVQSHYCWNVLCAHVEDPEEYDDDAEDIEIDPAQLVAAYYSSLTPRGIKSTAEEIDGRVYSVYEIPVLGCYLAIPQESSGAPFDRPIEGAWKRTVDGFHIYPDGLALRLPGLWAGR